MKRRLLAATIFALVPSLKSVAQEQPLSLVVRSKEGNTIEVLTATTGGRYMRRTSDGRWLGRASFLGDTYHFYDKSGRTIWIARPELQVTGTVRRALATVRDMDGRFIGIVTAQ